MLLHGFQVIRHSHFHCCEWVVIYCKAVTLKESKRFKEVWVVNVGKLIPWLHVLSVGDAYFPFVLNMKLKRHNVSVIHRYVIISKFKKWKHCIAILSLISRS